MTSNGDDGAIPPRRLADFKNAHAGASIVVCGCGESLNRLDRPERFVTIGVNDVGRLFDPTYLVVVDPREQFKGDRFDHVEASRASYLFTQRTDLELRHPRVVSFRLGEAFAVDFSDPDVLPHGVITPHVALSLAIHMGAVNIGLIGVDFTDNHFFGPTGAHPWSRQVDRIDEHLERLADAALRRGARLFNLSPSSRLRCLPRMALETFAGLVGGTSSPPRRIVSYATTPMVGVPTTLARCINARTADRARGIWAANNYGNGIVFDEDLRWTASPARALAELEAADVVILHNGRVDERHRTLIAGKPVITMAHNDLSDVDDRHVRAGFPGLVVGQYPSTLPEFAGWTPVPNPIELWEAPLQPSPKPRELTIAYTPAGRHETYPDDHPLYWHGRGYATTLRVLDRLAARHKIRLEVVRDDFVTHTEALAMKRRAHLLIDECVTGSYHRNSLEGLACGCVVVNGVGMLDGVAEALRHCAGGIAGSPFIRADLDSLEDVLEVLIGLGVDALAAHGACNRAWLERHWDFGQQWPRFWQPAIERAQDVAAREAAARRAVIRRAATRLSVVVVSLNEGEFLRRTVDNLAATMPPESEIVVVDDGSTDGSADFLAKSRDGVTLIRPEARLGSAKARNFGARHATGAIVVFSDAHIAVPPGWADPIVRVLDDPRVGAVMPGLRVMRCPDDYEADRSASSTEARGYGMRWSGADLGISWLPKRDETPFPAPLLGGAFLALRRNLFAAMGGFDPGLDIWGSEDAELSIRLWTLGYRCLVVPGVNVAHWFRATARPYAVGWESVLHNKLRLATLHFGGARRTRVFDALRHHAAFPAALARLHASDAGARRDQLQAWRHFDDDWFFAAFPNDPVPELSSMGP